MTLFFRLALLASALLFAACSKSHDHASHGGHAHRAPHGGTLVELGEHAYNLELVRDSSAGKLTVYILDGHAENFVRISAPSLELTAVTGGQKRTLSLKPVANTATGETVGNTSQYEAAADWLKSSNELAGTIESIEIKGTKFNQVGLHLR